MDIKLMQEAVDLTKQMVAAYYCERSNDILLNRMSLDSSWIGPGEREKIYSVEEMHSYLEQGEGMVPACQVSEFDLRATPLGEDYCLVVGSVTIRTTPDSELVLEVDQRLSFIYHFHDGIFEIVHIHNSNPYGEMETDEYFPNKMGAQSYKYLQKIVNEKTEVINMITDNINGGLKGSNDDSTFSYFYVNEGLPHMLGYTYDEFMEKTGGTAVGAVYPPDLQAALADCERCFAQGNVYSTEYRMEKRDRSLMWVLDSGRKAVDSEGITRINSIIMDVTPLKQALFELEIERERYRIALEHIVGAMCEYDVQKDIFTLYQKIDVDDKDGIRQSEITDFSQKMCSGRLSSIEDGVEFLSLCTGKKDGKIEFRTNLLYEDDIWHWGKFSCSVIADHNGAPVRAIGMLKDITEDKERNLELLKLAQHDGLTGLLNHTTVVETIQEYLVKCKETNSAMPALIMIDLDHFKEVNDSKGHAYGDKVLIETARILEEVAGVENVVGRIGGDEFLVLVKNSEQVDIENMGKEIVRRVREIGILKNSSVTCSIGIANCSHLEESFTHLFERVDKALYCAKDEGRDKVYTDLEV